MNVNQENIQQVIAEFNTRPTKGWGIRISGPVGVGKSQFTEQACRAANEKVFIVRVAFEGIDRIKQEDIKGAIVIFDELDAADNTTLREIMLMLSENEDQTLFVGITRNHKQGYVRLPSYLEDRMMHLQWEVLDAPGMLYPQ